MAMNWDLLNILIVDSDDMRRNKAATRLNPQPSNICRDGTSIKRAARSDLRPDYSYSRQKLDHTPVGHPLWYPPKTRLISTESTLESGQNQQIRHIHSDAISFWLLCSTRLCCESCCDHCRNHHHSSYGPCNETLLFPFHIRKTIFIFLVYKPI